MIWLITVVVLCLAHDWIMASNEPRYTWTPQPEEPPIVWRTRRGMRAHPIITGPKAQRRRNHHA